MLKYTMDHQIQPNYTFTLPVEREFNSREWFMYFYTHSNVFYLSCLAYIIIVYLGQMVMKNRSPINFGYFLFTWNFALAVFSCLGFSRMASEIPILFNYYKNWSCLVCIPQLETGPSALWQVLFLLSKFVEFGDTFLLIARKKPVIFLHWYHHTSVLLFTMHIVTRFSPIGRMMATVNYGVHSIMYSYFALTALGVKMPKWLAVSITSLQIIQMLIGISVAVTSITTCGLSDNSSAWIGIGIYFSYLVLFSQFFLQSYCSGKKRSGAEKKTK